MTDNSPPPTLRVLVRSLLVPVLAAALLATLLVLWIRAEPLDLARGPQVALALVVAALFGAVILAAHRAGE